MVVGSPLCAPFGDANLDAAWQVAGKLNPADDYLKAVELLVERRDKLGALVFVQVDPGNTTDWASIADHTIPLCQCGRRRLLVPGQGRDTFEPTLGESMILSADRGVTLAPWGGDRRSALVVFRRSGRDVSIRLPFVLSFSVSHPLATLKVERIEDTYYLYVNDVRVPLAHRDGLAIVPDARIGVPGPIQVPEHTHLCHK